MLLLAKIPRLEANLLQEKLARISAESALSKTSSNLTKTWRLCQGVTADLKNLSFSFAEELQKREALQKQLRLERNKYFKLDQGLKVQQQNSAVSRQQSQILAFMAPSPYLPKDGNIQGRLLRAQHPGVLTSPPLSASSSSSRPLLAGVSQIYVKTARVKPRCQVTHALVIMQCKRSLEDRKTLQSRVIRRGAEKSLSWLL